MTSYAQHTEALEALREAEKGFKCRMVFRSYLIWKEFTTEQREQMQRNFQGRLSGELPREGYIRLLVKSDADNASGVRLEMDQLGQPSPLVMLEQLMPLVSQVVERVWKRWLSGELQVLPPSTQDAEETRKMLEELPND